MRSLFSGRTLPALRHDFGPSRRRLLPWLMLSLGLLACGVVAWRATSVESGQQTGSVTVGVAPGMEQRGSGPTAGPATAARQEVQRRLDLPWGRLLTAVDDAATADVVLLAIAPDAVQGRAQVQAEAATPEAMLSFVTALTAQSGIQRAWLIEHEVAADHPQRPVRFTVDLRWSSP